MTRPLRWTIAAIVWAALTPGCLSMVTALTSPGPDAVVLVDEDFNEGRLLNPTAVTLDGFTPCLDGWCVGPGRSATLVYVVDVPASQRVVFANLWLYLPAGVQNRVQASPDGESYRTVIENVSLSNGRVELGERPASGRVWVRVEARNDGPDVILVLDKMVLRAAVARRTAIPGTARVVGTFLVCGLALLLVVPNRRLAAVLVLLVTVGLAVRYAELRERIDGVVDPDVQSYRVHARRMQLFTETGFFSARFDLREPGFIFIAHLVTRGIGDSDQTFRVMSVGFSLAMIVAAVLVGRRLVGDVAAASVGAALAVNGPLIYESVRGLRTELEAVALLAYLFLAFLWRRPPDAARSVVLGLAAGLLTLIRMTYLPAAIALNGLALWRPTAMRASVVRIVLATVLAVACVAPHRYGMYKVHGDPFWDTSAYARWNANFEFAGQPGFPTLAELQTDGYQGPKITYREYLFGLHTPGEVFEGTLRGFAKLVGHMDQCAFDGVARGTACIGLNRVVQALGVLGLLIALLRADRRWLPAAFVLVELPIAFLYDRADRGLTEVYRHTFPVFPVFLLAAAGAVQWTIVARRTRTAGPAGAGADR